MVGFVPKEMFFTKGVGKHREKLTSFELALRSAGYDARNYAGSWHEWSRHDELPLER